MKKRTTLIILCIILTSFFLSASLPAAGWWKYGLTIKNNTHMKAFVKLQAPKAYYYFRINPGATKKYTIKAATYKATFWGCYSKKIIKKWQVNRKYKILFPICGSSNKGNEMGVLRIIFPDPDYHDD